VLFEQSCQGQALNPVSEIQPSCISGMGYGNKPQTPALLPAVVLPQGWVPEAAGPQHTQLHFVWGCLHPACQR